MAAERDNEDSDELTGAGTPGRDGRDEPAESTESALGEAADADAVGDGDELDYMDLPEASGEVSSYALEGQDEDEDEDLDVEREETGESVTIEIAGLSLYTHHGVSEAEREIGQRLVFDLRLDIGETDATVTDSIEDTVDYGEVCQLVALIAQQRSHKTLERLCSTIADRLLGDYELEGVWVKATKPEPPIALPVDEVSVEVWREAEE